MSIRSIGNQRLPWSYFINFHRRYLLEMFIEGEDLKVILKADGSNENI